MFQVSTNGGVRPRWRRAGKEIYSLGPYRKLMAVDGKATATSCEALRPLGIVRSRRAPIYSTYDVTADGQRFLINTALEAEGRPPITVVRNWAKATEPLRLCASAVHDRRDEPQRRRGAELFFQTQWLQRGIRSLVGSGYAGLGSGLTFAPPPPPASVGAASASWASPPVPARRAAPARKRRWSWPATRCPHLPPPAPRAPPNC